VKKTQGVVMAMTGERLCLSLDGRVRYGGSKLRFRGPPKPLDGDFIACLGGTETCGDNVAHPFPDLLEARLGLPCVNFGWPNAGVDVFVKDRGLLDCANRAKLCVLQVPGATNLGNMYYRVHPRRNDRLLGPTDALRALFPEVDFTEFHFTRHLLCHLHDLCDRRFGYLRKELATVWQARMVTLLDRIEAPVILLWLSRRPLEDGQGAASLTPSLSAEPSLVSREMLQAVAPKAHALVIPERPRATLHVIRGGREARVTEKLSRLLPDDRAHAAAASALAPVLDRVMGD
jgi:hypothetical protein